MLSRPTVQSHGNCGQVMLVRPEPQNSSSAAALSLASSYGDFVRARLFARGLKEQFKGFLRSAYVFAHQTAGFFSIPVFEGIQDFCVTGVRALASIRHFVSLLDELYDMLADVLKYLSQ